MAFEMAPKIITPEKQFTAEKIQPITIKIPEKIRAVSISNGILALSKFHIYFPKKFYGATIIPINDKISGITNQETGKVEKLLVLPTQKMVSTFLAESEKTLSKKLGQKPTKNELLQFKSFSIKDLNKLSLGIQELSFKSDNEQKDTFIERQNIIKKINENPQQFITEYNEKRLEAKKYKKLQEGGFIIFDENQQLYINKEKLQDQRLIANFLENNKKNLFPDKLSIFNFLAHKKAKDITDKDNTEKKPENIFYLPETIEEAFDPKKIIMENSLIDAYDFFSNNTSFTIELPGDKKTVDINELVFVETLYKELKAYRDKNNKLWIFDNNQKKFVIFSVNKVRELTKKSFSYSDKDKKDIRYNNEPILFFTEKCPNLLQSDLLKISDIGRVLEGSHSESFYRLRRKINKSGRAIIAGVGVYLGAEYEGDDIVKLSDKLYGIVRNTQGDEKIIATVASPTDEQIAKKREQAKQGLLKKDKVPTPTQITANCYFRVGEIPVQPYKITERSKKLEDESPEEYAERIIKIKTFNVLNKLSHDLSQKTQIGLHNLTLKQQEWLTAGIDDIEKNYDDFIEFAKDQGLMGLKTLIAQEYSEISFSLINNINKKLEKKDSQKLFELYVDIIEESKRVAQNLFDSDEIETLDLSKKTQNSFTHQITEAIARRASQIFHTANQIALKKSATATYFDNKNLTCDNINEIHQALKLYLVSLQKINILLEGNNEKNSISIVKKIEGEASFYLFKITDTQSQEKSYLGLQTRKTGVHSKNKNQELEFDGEARINFLLSEKPISPYIKDQSRQDALSIRLDREGIVREGNKIIENDPTKKDGEISLDLGFAGAANNSENEILGRIISIGSYYSSQIRQKNPQFYHNRESFSKEIGQASTFEKIVELVEKNIKENYS